MLTVNKESPLTLLPIILMVYGLGMLTGAMTQKHHDAHATSQPDYTVVSAGPILGYSEPHVTTAPLAPYECITIAPHYDAPKSKHKSQREYKLPYKDDHGNITHKFEEINGICPTGNCLIQELQQ